MLDKKTISIVQNAINKLLDENAKLAGKDSLDSISLSIAQGDLLLSMEEALRDFKKFRGVS
jgi:hypothetical protein